MTLNDLQRAALALFAVRAAGQGGSLEQMKAIAYCIRNRVKAGWFDGQWVTVIEHAEESAANLSNGAHFLDLNNRALQRLVADIDDIYYGGRGQDVSFGGRVEQGKAPMPAQRYTAEGGDLEGSLGKSCYWCWINQPFTPWFQTNILDDPDNHNCRVQMGLMAFFE